MSRRRAIVLWPPSPTTIEPLASSRLTNAAIHQLAHGIHRQVPTDLQSDRDGYGLLVPGHHAALRCGEAEQACQHVGKRRTAAVVGEGGRRSRRLLAASCPGKFDDELQGSIQLREPGLPATADDVQRDAACCADQRVVAQDGASPGASGTASTSTTQPSVRSLTPKAMAEADTIHLDIWTDVA